MLTVPRVQEAINKGDWIATLNLKDAYFQIPIWECYWQFLMFHFEDLQNQSPPLRHRLGPLAIHKVYGHSPGTPLSPKYQGLELSRRLVGLCPDRKYMQVTRVCACEQSLTLGSSSVINMKKSKLEPSQITQFLGLILDSRKAIVTLT